jgi:hypothetical protein
MLIVSACSTTHSAKVLSPDENIEVQFFIDNDGQAAYTIYHKGQSVIDTSYLGFEFTNLPPIGKNLRIVRTSKKSLSEKWEMPWGEQRLVNNTYNELDVVLQEESETQRFFSIAFRVYNDFPNRMRWMRFLLPMRKPNSTLQAIILAGGYRAIGISMSISIINRFSARLMP